MNALTQTLKGALYMLAGFGGTMAVVLLLAFPLLIANYTGDDAWLWLYSIHVSLIFYCAGDI